METGGEVEFLTLNFQLGFKEERVACNLSSLFFSPVTFSVVLMRQSACSF
jgi:hypothetical protein